jgi:hypothetical protein
LEDPYQNSDEASQALQGDNSDMFSVPSFLLKTYDIVDVSKIKAAFLIFLNSHITFRTPKTQRLYVGLLMGKHSRSRTKTLSVSIFFLFTSNTRTSLASFGSSIYMIFTR